MRVQVIQTLEEAERFRGEWSALFADSSSALLYSDPDFCLNWYEQFVHDPRFVPWYHGAPQADAEARIELALGWCADRLDVVLPLIRVPLSYRGLRLRSLQCLINSHSDVSNLLLRNSIDGEGGADVLGTVLAGDTWHVLNLGKLPQTPEIAALMRAAEPLSMPLPIEDGARKYRLRYEGTFAEHLGRHASLRQNISYRRRRLQRDFGAYDVDYWSGPDAATRGFEIFLEVDAASWKRHISRGEALAYNPMLRRYYSRLCARFALRNACHVWVLRIGSTPVAAALCLESGGTLYGYKTSYDERFASGSPGFVLISLIAELTWNRFSAMHFMNDTFPEWRAGVDLFDSGTRAPRAYARRWHAKWLERRAVRMLQSDITARNPRKS